MSAYSADAPAPTTEFPKCTPALLVTGHGYHAKCLVRIEFDQEHDGSVTLTSRQGHTGTLIAKAGSIIIMREEWTSLDFDPLNLLHLTPWAFSKAGWI